jgi:hypothetical protein
VVKRILCRAPRKPPGWRGVQAILEDVEVKAAKVFRAKRLQPLCDLMEFIVAIATG